MSSSSDRPAESSLPRGPSEAEVIALRRDLVRAVQSVCPRWLADRSEDLVQVATLRALDALRRREGNEPLSTFYLRKAAYSAVVDEIRRLRRRRELPLEPRASETGAPDGAGGAAVPGYGAPGSGERAEYAGLDLVARETDPERTALNRQLGGAIRRCLERLARPRRLAVTLYLVGHSVPEAARLLGWTAKRAENLVYRGLADLRGCLSERGFAR